MLPTAKNTATFAYPKLKYGTITRTFTEAALAYNLRAIAERGQNRMVSGKTETLFNRIEDSLLLNLICEPDELQQLEWMFRDHGALGKPFEVWIDRHTGPVWAFNDSLRDQNGLKLTLNGGGTETYVDYDASLPGQRAISLTGTQYLSVATAQASAGTITGFDDPLSRLEGVLDMDFKPSFAGNDGVLHHIVDTSGTTANRLLLYKTAANALTFEIRDNAGGVKSKSASMSWGANTRVQILASWATDGTLKAWYATAGGPFTELTTAAGAGTGLLTTLGTTLYLGGENDGTDLALGAYDTFKVFKRAFVDPFRTLAEYRPLWRNYFPYAELEPLWQPARLVPSRAIFIWPLAVRNGVA